MRYDHLGMTSASSCGEVIGGPNIIEVTGKSFFGGGTTGGGNRYFSDHMDNCFAKCCFQRKQRNRIVAGGRYSTQHG